MVLPETVINRVEKKERNFLSEIKCFPDHTHRLYDLYTSTFHGLY